MTARRGLRGRDRRALLLGGALVGGMLLFSRVLPTLAAAEEGLLLHRERIATESVSWRRLARESLEFLKLLDPSTAGAPGAEPQPPLLRAPTAAAASALLLGRVSGLAEFAGATVLSATVAGDSVFRGEHVEVATRLSVSLDDVALVRFVSAIEADPAQLAVLSLHVVRANPSGEGAEARALRAEMLVIAIARRELESATAKEPVRVAAP